MKLVWSQVRGSSPDLILLTNKRISWVLPSV